jgi:hypothetical protein
MKEEDKLKLKIQSMNERFTQKVMQYEDEISNLRVEITIMVDSLNARIAELESELNDRNNETVPPKDE